MNLGTQVRMLKTLGLLVYKLSSMFDYHNYQDADSL